MLSGVHELLHLTQCTVDFGPLNSTNCFQFEEMNRKLIGFLHGYDLIGEELIKIFLGAQVLSNYSNNINNTKLSKFIQTRILFRTSNKKNKAKNLIDSVSIRKLELSCNLDYIRAFENITQTRIAQITICHNLVFNGIHYSSHYHKTKRCDACFKKNNNQLGLIECFIISDNKVYVIAKRIISLFNSFYANDCPEIGSCMLYCNVSDQLFVTELKGISKTVIVYDNENCFVSLFKSSYLFS